MGYVLKLDKILLKLNFGWILWRTRRRKLRDLKCIWRRIFKSQTTECITSSLLKNDDRVSWINMVILNELCFHLFCEVLWKLCQEEYAWDLFGSVNFLLIRHIRCIFQLLFATLDSLFHIRKFELKFCRFQSSKVCASLKNLDVQIIVRLFTELLYPTNFRCFEVNFLIFSIF